MSESPAMEFPRQEMEVDIVCVGFGPAAAGFLTTLSRGLVHEDGSLAVESQTLPGAPPQVICYERADDLGFGVSGVVTKGRAIKASFPDLDPKSIPMCAQVGREKLVHLLDPQGASRRSTALRAMEKLAGPLAKKHAVESPFIPPYILKHDGLTFSLGQFLQWAGSELMGSGLVQIWPSTPVAGPLIENGKVVGVRLIDQGVDKQGNPDAGYMPGMDVKAALTVAADGPVGPVGRQLDEHFGLPKGHHQRDWAVGMKMVVDLPETCEWEEGFILHTMGYPEPEIFGFLYVLPDRTASLGIFVPSWLKSPVRTAYRYLQHWMMHPYIWPNLKGGKLRSWGAKSLQESGVRGAPHLVGDGFARIGEGSGSTNVLSNSGVDEAWATGVQLGEAVLELLKAGLPFTKENLESTYVRRRENSFVHQGGTSAKRARDGFHQGMIPGLLGMAMAGATDGRLNWPSEPKPPYHGLQNVEQFFAGRIPAERIQEIRRECAAKGSSLHDALLTEAGWPEIPYDGELLISHQDALLMGGKVQAPPGYADHVRFLDPEVCRACDIQICVEACSGQAITLNPDGGAPLFDREKCVHCGACIWNCSKPRPGDPDRMNVLFTAGAGGLHSAEN
ncbi:MAG: 4Fe-4S ferredoxin [Desulfovibrionaceae bacterium]